LFLTFQRNLSSVTTFSHIPLVGQYFKELVLVRFCLNPADDTQEEETKPGNQTHIGKHISSSIRLYVIHILVLFAVTFVPFRFVSVKLFYEDPSFPFCNLNVQRGISRRFIKCERL
jgi:hypothetical protein